MIQSKLARGIKQSSECLISLRNVSSQPARTCLHDFHVSQGGKMVDFAGDFDCLKSPGEDSNVDD